MLKGIMEHFYVQKFRKEELDRHIYDRTKAYQNFQFTMSTSVSLYSTYLRITVVSRKPVGKIKHIKITLYIPKRGIHIEL